MSPSLSRGIRFYITAIILRAEGGIIGKQDIVLRMRNQLNDDGNDVLATISVVHSAYDSLRYVLLLYNGKDGDHLSRRCQLTSARQNEGKKTALLMFYAHQPFQSTDRFNTILPGGRVLQRYIVEQYRKLESKRLKHLLNIWQKLPASSYTALCDVLEDFGNNEDETDAIRAGRLFSLVSLHVGVGLCRREIMHCIIALSNTV